MVCQYFSVILELNGLMRYPTKLPFPGSLLVPKPTDRSGIGRFMGVGLFFDDEDKPD